MPETARDPLPDDADPGDLLAAYLTVHAQGAPVPAVLYARGEALHQRLVATPPASVAWGRFLVAQGQLAAEALGDDQAASRYFLAALTSVAVHNDHEVGVAAGYNQGVLHERRGGHRGLGKALHAYRAAASEGLRLGVLAPCTIQAALAVERLTVAGGGRLEPGDAGLLKLAWMAWLHLRRASAVLDAELRADLERSLAAYLLPDHGDEVPGLEQAWTAWPPHQLTVAGDAWNDHHPAVIAGLYAAAADAAAHLADAGADPGTAYRAQAERLRSG